MATQVLNQIAQYLATVPLARRQQQQENEFANRRLALQEEEDKRKAQMDAINQQLAQGTLANAQFEAEQRQKGQGQLEDYGRAAEIQPSINELRQGKELSKNVAPYSMDYLLAQPEATPLALADKYKLSQASPYNKGAASTMEQLNKEEASRINEIKANKNTGLGMTTIQKRDDWNRIASMPDGPEKDQAIDDYMMVYAPGTKYPLTDKGIGERVGAKYAEIAPEVAKSGATSKASVIGKSEGETESNLNAIPGFKPIAGTKITNESVKKVKDSAPLINNINKITDEILNDIKAKGYKYTGDDAAKYNANIRYLQMLAKSEPVFNLGVITGPDLMLLDQIIADPSSLKQGMKSTVLGSVETRLKQFQNNLNSGATEKYRANGFEPEEQKKKKKVYNPETGKFEPR